MKLIIFGNKYLFWVVKLRRCDVLLKGYLLMVWVIIYNNRLIMFVWRCVCVKEMLNVGLFWDKVWLLKVMKWLNMCFNSFCCYCFRLNKENINVIVVFCWLIYFFLMRYLNDGYSLFFNKVIFDFIVFIINYINLGICVW